MEVLPSPDSHEPNNEASIAHRSLARIIAPVKELRERLYYWTCEKLGQEPNPDDLK